MDSIGHNTQLWISLGYCAFMLALAIILRKNPPKEINPIYGYRTSRSMKNKTVWKAANDYSAELMVRFCSYSFLFPVVCYFLFPEWNLLVTIIGNTILILLIIYFTETYLNKNFDKEGNQLAPDSTPKS